MKNKKLIRAMDLVDDKYVTEAAPSLYKTRNHFSRGLIIAACICVMVTVLSLVLFMPYKDEPVNDDLKQYESSEYYDIIVKLDAITRVHSTKDESYKNNFDMLTDVLLGGLMNGAVSKDDAALDMPSMAPDMDDAVSNGTEINDGGSYSEITDNQVAGVTEADLIKRSGKYIYYLNPASESLYIYTIEGDNSKRVASFKIKTNAYARITYASEWEFYLSEDCNTVTVVAPYYAQKVGSCVELIAIDVSNVNDISVKNRVCMTGDLLSTRVKDGKILLMTRFAVPYNPDFSDESTFLPQIGDGENAMTSCAPDKIFCPEEVTEPRYTVVAMLEEGTLVVKDTAAYLSYSEEAYVSADTVYVTRSYLHNESDGAVSIGGTMTDIALLKYSGESFEHCGTATVEGYIKNQYSLDEYNGILRVVTTVDTTVSKIISGPNVYSNSIIRSGTSASLWCIDINTLEIVASVKDFAPKGETVESVRFDGNTAYVCTAVVITFTDPVFFFDLSDLDNITYTDTGDISGYSSSLINFGNGFLVGIGYGDNRNNLKVEVYAENGKKVEAVSSFEMTARFSEEYKSYYVDRENQLIGIGVNHKGQTGYIVLHFDGHELKLAAHEELMGSNYEYSRGVYIEDRFYIVSEGDFVVTQLFKGSN